MAIVSSKDNEQRLLALFMIPPTHMRVLSIDMSTFASRVHKKAAELIRSYVRKYKNPPTLGTLTRFSNAALRQDDVDTGEEIVEALTVLSNLPIVQPSDADFEFDQAENYRIGRLLIDVASDINSHLETGKLDYIKAQQDILRKLLVNGEKTATVSRGMIYNRVNERYELYKNIKNGNHGDVIPYGMKAMDAVLGGMRRTFVTLLYSKTGGGKTRTMVNVAYNAAQLGYNVMYISLEMNMDLIATCFDSRMAWVNGEHIVFGKLSDEDRAAYKKALQKQFKEKLNVWIVDVSMGAKSTIILEEVEVYRALHGVPPDLVVVDYANIMTPEERFNGRSEKYDCLFSEFHNIAKYTKCALLTATQESRDASKEDIEAKKKNEAVEQGVHKIGLSNYMAPHCETVLRLKQDNGDRVLNKLFVIIDKNRYGAPGTEIPLTALWDKNYVGDRKIEDGLKISREYVLKDASENQAE